MANLKGKPEQQRSSKNTEDQEKVRQELKYKAQARAEQWFPIELKELPEPELLQEIVLMGSYSYSLPQTRRRLVRGTLEIIDGVRETPTSIARDYLRIKYTRGPKVNRDQFLTCRDGTQPYPNVARPGKYDHGVYVDIQSAYWSIMGVVGWDVDYHPGRWIAPGIAPRDFPFSNHKICRNCLVSSGAYGSIMRYIPQGKYDEIRPGSSLANPGLIRLISDVLNAIAWQGLQAGAIYANTDGLIAPNLKIAAEIIGIINDWGLTAHVKSEGPGSVKSSGAYAVGQDKSVPWKIRNSVQPVENIHPPRYIEWLQDNFSYWASNPQS